MKQLLVFPKRYGTNCISNEVIAARDDLLSCVNLIVSTPPWSVWTWTSGAIALAATGMARKSSKGKILQIPALQIPSNSNACSSDSGIQDRSLKELELQMISTSCFGGIQ
jgi:hypothetical protein